jgi:hypothetical protein
MYGMTIAGMDWIERSMPVAHRLADGPPYEGGELIEGVAERSRH